MPTQGLSDILGDMSCPYCASPLEARWVGDTDLRGALHCACGNSPVIDGVVWLSRRWEVAPFQENPARDAASRKIALGDDRGALGETLVRSSRLRWWRVARLLERLGEPVPEWILNFVRRHIAKTVTSRNDLTFVQALTELRNGPYADYLYQRYVNPSLMAAIPVMSLLAELKAKKPGPPRVLEIGGGAGHANFLMQRVFPDIQFILTDADWTNLYLARRFIAPRAVHICLDAEDRLPFADHSIDAVYCQDSFHYMRSKAGIVQELRRVVKPDGLWIFPHLHNALKFNPAPGMPLRPADYAHLFSSLNARLFPEPQLLQNMRERRIVDLSITPNQSELDDANALTMIAGPSDIWRTYPVPRRFVDPAPDFDVNRIYSRPGLDGSRAIAWPNGALREECVKALDFLPETVRIEPSLLDRLHRGALTETDKPEIEKLIRDFILVPTPPTYG